MHYVLKIFITIWLPCAMSFVISHALQIYHDNEAEVIHLIGEPDFRDVSLRWESPEGIGGAGIETNLGHSSSRAFRVRYCELQAWGPHRCRNKVIEEAEASTGRRGRSGLTYGARIGGLRMATTYSFEVLPLAPDGSADNDDLDSPTISKNIIVPTKGFSARATQCLPHASEVEVSTGPHFGGRIAVEATDGRGARPSPACQLAGNPASAQDTYTLRIDHDECGSDVNETTVATYVIVQENLPILTHSTRRFLVLCTYKPETLTVRAGINLPSNGLGSQNSAYYKSHAGSVEPHDSQEMEYNEVQSARLQAEPDDADDTGGVTGQVALVVFLIVAGFASVALLLWRMIPNSDGSDISIRNIASKMPTLQIFTRFTRKYQDSISDSGSIYSISLSDKEDNKCNGKNIDSDNTSEA